MHNSLAGNNLFEELAVLRTPIPTAMNIIEAIKDIDTNYKNLYQVKMVDGKEVEPVTRMYPERIDIFFKLGAISNTSSSEGCHKLFVEKGKSMIEFISISHEIPGCAKMKAAIAQIVVELSQGTENSLAQALSSPEAWNIVQAATVVDKYRKNVSLTARLINYFWGIDFLTYISTSYSELNQKLQNRTELYMQDNFYKVIVDTINSFIPPIVWLPILFVVTIGARQYHVSIMLLFLYALVNGSTGTVTATVACFIFAIPMITIFRVA
jgi:hypothetical protein